MSQPYPLLKSGAAPRARVRCPEGESEPGTPLRSQGWAPNAPDWWWWLPGEQVAIPVTQPLLAEGPGIVLDVGDACPTYHPAGRCTRIRCTNSWLQTTRGWWGVARGVAVAVEATGARTGSAGIPGLTTRTAGESPRGWGPEHTRTMVVPDSPSRCPASAIPVEARAGNMEGQAFRKSTLGRQRRSPASFGLESKFWCGIRSRQPHQVS